MTSTGKSLARTRVARVVTSLCAAAALSLTLDAAQAAGWSCIHGSAGQIEYENQVATMNRVHIGWGLDFEENAGTANWVHFAIPTVFGAKARFVALQFETGSVDAFVDEVHVYNLGTKVDEFFDLGWSGNLQVESLDMGVARTFGALGISVKVAAGVEMMDHGFLFTGACAYFEP